LLYKVIKTEIFITYCQWKNYTILHFFYDNVNKYPDDIAFIGIDGNEYTFRQFETQANKICIYFESLGFKAGDCVAFFDGVSSLTNSINIQAVISNIDSINIVPRARINGITMLYVMCSHQVLLDYPSPFLLNIQSIIQFP
ncbi:hypothetical protein HZS_1233, partial [Henneguya salminicola]